MKIDKTNPAIIRFSFTEPTEYGPVEVTGRMEDGKITITCGDYRFFTWDIAKSECTELSTQSCYNNDRMHAYDRITGSDMARFAKSFVNYWVCDSLFSFGYSLCLRV